MKIAIGCDHAATERKAEVIDNLKKNGHEVKDFGTYTTDSIDYADIAFPLCEAVAKGEFDRGILICGTGIGMSICANKVKGIRCALCSESFSARMTRKHNDTNVLSMGARTIGTEVALDIVDTWLNTAFEGGRHQRRIDKIAAYEAK